MKRKILLTLGLLFSAVTLLGVLTACGGWLKKNNDEDKASGSEAGEYYCDYDGVENDLTLGGKCEFELKIGTTVMKGGYELDGENLTFSPENAGTISARYKNERISFTYSNVSYTFLRKIDYTVTFNTDGGTAIGAVTVRNGRTLARPADPEKGDLIFVGWYTDAGHTNPFYFSQPITENKTLYARYVEPLESEFDVKFDLGYTGATAVAPIRTAGHKVYPGQLPVPVRTDNVAFVGWYVSDFETRNKLSREFDVETEVGQDFTLYAVWEEVAGAPVVSVSESGVEISAEGENLSYNLKLTDPAGNEFSADGALATGATTIYSDYDFTEGDAGEYKVEVEVAGKTTTRYLNNKALARVSEFRVESVGGIRTLIFNGVADAEEYKITVECGTAGHTNAHRGLSIGSNTFYDFSKCAMGADGTIKFTVEASANGHASSTSVQYIYDATLDAVDDIEFDEATGDITWSKVEYATAYRVTVSLNNHQVGAAKELFADDVSGKVMRYSMKGIGKGDVTVAIVPIAFGWNSPEASEYNFQKTSTATPTNVRTDGEKIKWDKVDGATGYEVVIGNATKNVAASDNPEYTLQADDFGTNGEAQVTVYAVGANGADRSYASDTITVVNNNEIRNLTYSGGYATWDAVFGATSYQYKVGDGAEWTTVTEPKAAIKFNAAGQQTIHVKAVTTGGDSQEETTTVTVSTLQFDIGDAANEIDLLPDQYLAEGDPIAFPTPAWIGYDFEGWYMGADETDDEYGLTVFHGGDTLKLFAHFTPKTFTITLVAGSQGEWTEQMVTVYYRQSGFTLPVPTPNSVEYTFQGWYRGVGGTGARFADIEGGNTGTYTLLKDITVYAKWVTPFSYMRVQGGYSISANSSIGSAKEITIPSTHNGQKVVTVEDFNAGTSLEVINIPNTVETISLGSVGKAFESLTKLKAINVYSVVGNRTPTYASEDGMLYEVESKTLIYVPTAYKTPTDSTEVTLPEGIQSIRAGAIYQNTTITKLTIPASVTEVQKEAIYGLDSATKDKLTAIEFQSATEGGSLTIADGAFVQLGSLATITIPKYTADFSAAKWDTCAKITDIKVTGAQAGDAIFDNDGVLCRTIQDETGATQEIVYYPVARTATTYAIPDGISSIGEGAFKGETNFTSMIIPAQITHIGEQAFYGCSALVTLTFEGTENSKDLTIEQQAFYNCNFTSVTLPANLVKTEWEALYSKSSAVLETVTFHGRSASLGGKTPEIAPATFNFKSSGTTVNLDANYPAINLASALAKQGQGSLPTAVPDASVVKTIVIDPNNKNYVRPAEGEDGYGGIFNADKTQILFIENKTATFTIPNTVTEIGSLIFKSNTTLTSITIPASVTTIADYAFQKCTKLTSITFAPTAPGAERAPLTIGKSAFNSCNNAALTSIVLPEETTEIGESAFSSCSKLTSFTVPKNVKHIYASTFAGCSKLESIELQEGLLSIGDSAFSNCSVLNNIAIPASVETIGTSAFYNCNALSTLTVAEQSKTFTAKEGALYEKTLRPGTADVYDETTLTFVAKSATGDAQQALNIPATVTTVLAQVMYGNTTIKAVKFAGAVKGYTEEGTETLGTLTIGEKAFYGAVVETVKFPAGLRELAPTAGSSNGIFYNCKQLTSVNIPYTVTSIGGGTFSNCVLLNNITFDATPEGTDSVPLVLATETYSNSPWYGVFYMCSGLTQLELPERTTRIEKDTFWGTGLTKLTLPSTLQEISDYAISGEAIGYSGSKSYSLKELEEIVLPDHFAEGCVIGTNAISNLPALTKLGNSKKITVDDAETQKDVWFLPEGIKEIAYNAINYLPGITSIGLPSTLERIGDESSGSAIIQYCENLETVAFADGCALEKIGSDTSTGNTFINPYGTSGVKNVIFGENVKLRDFGGNGGNTVSLFGNTAALTSITIPASVETIGPRALMNLANLTEVKFEAGSKLTSVGGNAFQNTGLTEFTFPDATDDTGEISEIKVGESVFNGCSSLATINLSKSIWDVTGLFVGCSALETVNADPNSEYFKVDNRQKIIFGLDSNGDTDTVVYVYGVVDGTVTLPEGTLEVAEAAYRGQTGITSLVLPSTLIRIGAGAFENCVNLANVTINVASGEASALSIIDDKAFNNCQKLASFAFDKAVNLNRIGANAFQHCGFTKLDLSHNVMLDQNAFGSTVKGIGNYAFAYNVKLGTELLNADAASPDYTSIKLPNGISSFGTYVFAYDTALEHIDLRNTSYTAIPNYTFSGCTALSDVKLPAGIVSIGRNAFENAGLQDFDLSGYEALTTIGQNAFAGSAITSVKLPETITSLGINLFLNCTSLEEADLSACAELSSLSNQMFNGCSELTTVKLPANIESIGNSAFLNCAQLSTITLPANLTSITTSAFSGCTNLTQIAFPATLESIGNTAFTGSGLTSIDLSKTAVTAINKEAFKDCASLETVTLPNGLKTIGVGAFSGTAISTITLPDSITQVAAKAFQNCTNLTSVQTTATTTFDVGGYAFSGCTSLATFPFEKIKSIIAEGTTSSSAKAENVFENTGFETVTVPAALCVKAAFSGCTQLTDVTFATDVTRVYDNMFLGCTELARVTFKAAQGAKTAPEALTLTTISASAFSGCSSLATITFEGALTNFKTLGSSAFKGTDISSIDFSAATGLKTISGNAFEDCASLTSVTLPESVTTISSYAFSGCTSLTQNGITMTGVTSIGAYAFSKTGFTSFTINGNITTVGGGAFSDCEHLTNVTVAGEDNEHFVTGTNGEIYQLSKTSGTNPQDLKTLIYYPANAETLSFAADMTDITDGSVAGYTVKEDGSKEFTIPTNIKHIKANAFRGVALDKLIVPDSDNLVGGIANSAFGESLIKEIVFNCGKDAFASNVQSLFKNNTALTSITFPSDLTEIGTLWFDGCTSLKTIEIPSTVTSLAYEAFMNSSITSLTIPNTVKSLGTGAFANMPDLTTIEINANITKVDAAGSGYQSSSNPSSLFENSTQLANVTLGGKLTAVSTYWFRNLPNLKNITIPATVTAFGTSVFAGSGLESITFASRTKALTLGNSIFANTKLKTLSIPGEVASLPSSMVADCTELKWVYLEEGVTTISGSAFSGCTALKFVNIPSTVTTLDMSAFKGATSVHIFIPSTVGTITTSTTLTYKWNPTESNHIYFGASLYEAVVTYGLDWFNGTDIDTQVSFGSNYQAAYTASGLTDEDNFPLKPSDADENGKPKAE